MTRLFICLVVLLGQGCTFLSSKENDLSAIQLIQTNENFIASSTTYNGIPLHSGQIVVSESGNQYSLLFSILPEKFSSHIHAGILIFENGEPYVYEALGNVGLFLGSQPTDNISGHVRRRPLHYYVLNENYTSIYNLPEHVDKQKLIDVALSHYQRETPFDPYADTEDRDRVYCTEFVAIALEQANKDKITLTPYQNNNSIKKLRNWLKFDSEKVILADSLVQPENHVVTMSPKLSLTELKLYILMRYELHRRFTENQRLGNLFEWTGSRLTLRAPVEQFRLEVLNLFNVENSSPTWEEAHVAVRNLANQMLGNFQEDSNALGDVNLINYRIR